jgi:hypothetical protein
MTVPPLFGWEVILIALVVLVAVAVAFLVIASARASTSERSEWQAWLDARSGDQRASRRVLDREGERGADGR